VAPATANSKLHFRRGRLRGVGCSMRMLLRGIQNICCPVHHTGHVHSSSAQHKPWHRSRARIGAHTSLISVCAALDRVNFVFSYKLQITLSKLSYATVTLCEILRKPDSRFLSWPMRSQAKFKSGSKQMSHDIAT
jgi:hypothetical protein